MLSGETIIYFGPEPWHGLWRNRHQLMSRFAADNDVWYVEPPANLFKLLSGKARRPARLTSTDASGVHIFHSPWWLPFIGREPFKSFTVRILLAVLSRAARLGRDRRPITWFSKPNMVGYLGKLQTKMTIYHVVDEYSGYGRPSEARRQKQKNMEENLMRSADATIVVTQSLYDLKSPYNENTHLVPNAVDYDSYANKDTEEPGDMSGIDGPVIGYSGLVAARLDLELLQAAAESRPDWHFVFVGTVDDAQCKAQIKGLGELPNVHLLGQKAVDEVPAYVQRFDVSVIPYVLNLRAQHASPLKLYEYSAASKPIVTTDFAAARAFEGHISIASGADEFVAACEQALSLADAAAEIEANRAYASENTWSHRVEQISDIIRDQISE